MKKKEDKRPTKPRTQIDYSHNRLQIMSDRLPRDFIIKTLVPIISLSFVLVTVLFYLFGVFKF